MFYGTYKLMKDRFASGSPLRSGKDGSAANGDKHSTTRLNEEFSDSLPISPEATAESDDERQNDSKAA